MINAYIDRALGATIPYNPEQINLIKMMIGPRSSSLTPINTLDKWLTNIQDNIPKANLDIEEQTPLLLAIEAGNTIHTYWTTTVGTPGNWAGLGTFSADDFKNYDNISLWTVSCMEGALIGGNATRKGLIAPSTDITSVNIISALIGALAIGAGKVLFGWVPEIQPKHLISDNNGLLQGGFSNALDDNGSTNPLFKGEPVNNCTSFCSNNSCGNTNCTNSKKCIDTDKDIIKGSSK